MPFLSFDAVCVGSSVTIILFYKNVNKQVHKILEFSTPVENSNVLCIYLYY